ncbi:hypothetical protein ABBQ32_004855 [Trebouxia sp. C0010 RCD-2024]
MLQGEQPPMDFVLQAQQMHRLKQELWPHCQPLLDSDTPSPPAKHIDKQNLAICQEVDSLLAGLQSSWHTLHQHSQACSVLGLTPGIPPCSPDYPPSMPMSSQPYNPQLLFAPKSTHQQRQQFSTQSDCLHPGSIATDGVSCSNKSPTAERTPVSKPAHAGTQTADASQPLLFPGPILTQPSGQQQQHQTGHDTRPPQQQLGPVDQSAKPDELLVPPELATKELKPGSWLGGGVLVSTQRLWRELIYDSQVVQKQLENEAGMGGQACRSCLVPHLQKSHQVVALLVLFALCASGLFVAATFYRRRQSTRRQIQNNIATQRQRHFEKLQQQQQQQQQQRLQQRQRQQEEEWRSVEEPSRPTPLPLLQGQPPSPAVAVKHARHRFKSGESTIPSSPSASSSRSEAIGTQVRSHSQSDKAEEPKRARSAQRSVVDLGPVDSLVHGLGRSQSDLSREAAQHGPFEMPQRSMHSMQGAEGPVQDPISSSPSTPSSMAGSTIFNPFHQAPSSHQTLPASSDSSKAASATSVDGTQHAKQAGSRRRNRHKGKAAKKTPPTKRRFIPGLDSEFDPDIHELPTPPQDPSTDPVRQRGAVQSVGCSSPSSSSSALPQFQTRRQLSVDAPVFVPTGYPNMNNFICGASQYPFTQLPEWQPQSDAYHADGLCHMLRTGHPGVTLPDPTFNPQLPQTSNFPFSTYLTRVSPIGHTMYREDLVAPTPRPAVPMLSSQTSPTSVLPDCLPSCSDVGNPILSSMICSSSSMSAPFATAGEQQPQLSFIGSPRGWGLPPLLEEGLGSPFPGMPSRTSERPFHTTVGHPSAVANVFSAPTSAGPTLPEQPHVSTLPGFNSIWKSSDTHSSEGAWHSFTADRKGSIW